MQALRESCSSYLNIYQWEPEISVPEDNAHDNICKKGWGLQRLFYEKVAARLMTTQDRLNWLSSSVPYPVNQGNLFLEHHPKYGAESELFMMPVLRWSGYKVSSPA